MNNIYLEEFNKLISNRIADRYIYRYEMVKKYAWAIPNNEALECVKKYDPIIEIGAGLGYWARLLAEMGVDIVAFDIRYVECYQYWFHIKLGSYEKIKEHPNRTLMLCWPPYESDLMDLCLDVYTNNILIYVGEYNGCTAWSNRLGNEWVDIETIDIPQWDTIHDYLTVFKRKL